MIYNAQILKSRSLVELGPHTINKVDMQKRQDLFLSFLSLFPSSDDIRSPICVSAQLILE